MTTYDPAAVRSWLRILHGDTPGHLSIVSTTDWAGRAFPTTNIEQAAAYVDHLNGAGVEGIYARITSMVSAPAAGKRSGAAQSAALPALWADLDLAGPGHAEKDLPPDEDAGRAIITATGLPDPTLWIHSGGGLYPIWLLDAPHQITPDNLEETRRLAKDWQAVIEHAAASLGYRYGRGVGDLARVLRIPGTINRKEGLARPCRIITATAGRHRIDQLIGALDMAVARIAPRTVAATPAPLGPVDPVAPSSHPGAITPGDDYAARTSWAQILEPAGWRVHYHQDDTTYWTRPGKTTGTSGSTNALGTDRLHIFTSNAAPLDGGESYSKFGAYCALRHGGDHAAAAKALAAAGYGTPLPNPAVEHLAAITDILGEPPPPPPRSPPPAPVPGRAGWTPEVDATNPAVAADWLRAELGRHRLAGFFSRSGQIVHTPREGEDGYQHLGRDDEDDDGPAQIRPVTDSVLASRVTYTYGVFRLVKRGDEFVEIPALFPKPAARLAVDAPDMMPHLRPIRGVVHTPVLRADGTVLVAPGYDLASRLLHLPAAGLDVPAVADQPTGLQVADAVALLGQMIDGFAFLSKHDRANYVGLLLTPLLRELVPPPYQLGGITAPQPGSGKTLLANLARIIHGGVFRAEMPTTDDELRKSITTILDQTTGPIVHFDNVTGTLRSSVVAGLLTSDKWDDRRLGTMEMIRTRNDRLWIVTGNNLALGGDLARRTIWVTIDPQVPDPHLRTGFAITDLERWTRQHRAGLIHALLTIARSWVAQGKPVSAAQSSDSYSWWIQAVRGILATAGIEGTFADPDSARQEIGADDEEWNEFLTRVSDAFGDKPWTVKELLSHVDSGNLLNPGLIPMDALPSELAEKASRPGVGLSGITKSLGWWLRNRDGRWAGGLTVRVAGPKVRDGIPWRVERNDGGRS